MSEKFIRREIPYVHFRIECCLAQAFLASLLIFAIARCLSPIYIADLTISDSRFSSIYAMLFCFFLIHCLSPFLVSVIPCARTAIYITSILLFARCYASAGLAAILFRFRHLGAEKRLAMLAAYMNLSNQIAIVAALSC